MILDFNDNWTFRREGEQKAVPIRLPHDAMLIEPRRPDARGGTNNGYFPGGVYVYEKRFDLDAADVGKSFVLHFEGVYRDCTVSVNGRVVCRHRYGFTAFDADSTDFVQAGENTVTVRVDNSLQPNCRWYTGSGIYRPVTLLVRDRDYVKTLRIRTVSADPATIEVETDGDAVTIYDGETVVASGKPGLLTVPDAKLWSDRTPHLYTCAVRKGDDERRERFGIRELKWSAQDGLTVNGESVKLRGGCIHHDHGVLGACEYRESEFRRIRILKENGFNAVRVSHNPASRILLDACDEIGMYVLDESFDGWYTPKTYHDYARVFADEWQNDLRAMVASAYNHPCVILYSIGNEVTETAEEKGVALCKRMRDYVRGMDDTRPVTAGINVLLDVYARRGIGIYRDKGAYTPELQKENRRYRERKTGSAFFNYWTQKLGGLMFSMSKGKTAEKILCALAPSLDIVGLNYASSRYDADARNYPDRLMLGTETMCADLPYNWARVQQYPQLLGDFVWAAWDYIGETCMGWYYPSYPGLPLLSGQGMIDITGLPLAQMAFLQTVWGFRKEPYIGVRPLNHGRETPVKGAWQFTNALDSWTWHGFEGTKATVEVYADAASVRLSLNGKTVGVRPVKTYKAVFRVPYAPGTLRAEALDGRGSPISMSELHTGAEETILSVRPEKAVAKPGDIVYVPVEFTDKDGVLKPYLEKMVALSVTGGELLGFGSALCKTDEVFDQPHHRTYRGRALAVVRAGAQKNVIIRAESGACSGEAEIEVQK